MKRYLLNLASVLAIGALSCAAQTAVYPSSISTLANLKYAVNGVSTLLTANINSSQTTFGISACAGIVANVLITIDSEIMPVTGCSGTVLVVGSRGFDGTTAAAHTAPDTIYAFVDAWNINSPNAEIIAIETALGANLSNVLANGSSPSLVNLTLSGTLAVTSGTLSGTHLQNVGSGDSPTFTGLTLSGIPTLPTQTANYFFAGPASGSAAAPAFRAIVAADIPVPLALSGSVASALVSLTQSNASNYALTLSAVGPGLGITTSGNGTALSVSMGGSTGHALSLAQTSSAGTATAIIGNNGSDNALTVTGNTTVTGNFTVTGTCTGCSSVSTETANYVYAGPVSGGASDPTFRALVSADLPAPFSITQSSSTATATIANGSISGYAAIFNGVGPTVDIASSGNGTVLNVTMGGSTGHALNVSQTSSAGTATAIIGNGGSDNALRVAGTSTFTGNIVFDGTLTSGSSVGVTSTTCTVWTNGLCTHN
jgi:hypothetical protein